jgi:hypothetical protein
VSATASARGTPTTPAPVARGTTRYLRFAFFAAFFFAEPLAGADFFFGAGFFAAGFLGAAFFAAGFFGAGFFGAGFLDAAFGFGFALAFFGGGL